MKTTAGSRLVMATNNTKATTKIALKKQKQKYKYKRQ
jgi:hypothetical protein